MKKFATCVGYTMIGAAFFAFAGIVLAIVLASNAGRSSSTQARNERATNEAEAAFVAANATVEAKATATAQAGPTEFPTDFVYPTAGLRPTDTAVPVNTPVPTMTALPLPTATGAAEAAVVASPTMTLAPTATPLPTVTNVPTLTPIPTDTARPLPTATASKLPAGERDVVEQVYIAAMSANFKNLVDAMIELGRLMQGHELFSPEWRIDIVKQMEIVRISYRDTSELNPPAQLLDFQSGLVQAMRDCDTAMDYLLSSLQDLNTDDLKQSRSLMISCAGKLQPLSDELKSLAE